MHKGKEAMEGMKAFEGEHKVGRERKKKLMEWDRLLKDFRYGDALDSVLRKVSVINNPALPSLADTPFATRTSPPRRPLLSSTS